MKIAIVKLSAMGDIIHAAVVLQFIKTRFPQARIDWIAEEVFAPLLRANPDIDTVHTVNLKRIKKEKSLGELKALYRRLKALGPYDQIIDMQGLFKSALISRIMGKNVCGFDRRSMREGGAALFYRGSYPASYDMNVILRGASLVSQCLEIPISERDILNKKPFLFADAAAKEAVAEYTAGTPPVLVMVGASWPSKVYPPERMAEVITGIGREALVIWGSDAEKDMAEVIVSLTPLATMAKKLSLSELTALVEQAALVIGGDTGPVHMAWALNRPSVTIFGPTPSFRNTMTTAINKTVDTGKPVDPSNLDRNDFSIRDIDPVQIVETAAALLKGHHE